MNYADLRPIDVANGPGIRVSLFVSGCTHHCKGCFNAVAWDFDYGQPFTQETIDSILEMLQPAYVKGITLLGGEPFEPENQPALVSLLRRMSCVVSFGFGALIFGERNLKRKLAALALFMLGVLLLSLRR